MKNFKLNEDESELLDSLELEEWNSVDNLKEEISSHQKLQTILLKKTSV